MLSTDEKKKQGNFTSTDGNMTNTDDCAGQAYLPEPAQPDDPTPTKADLKYLAPVGSVFRNNGTNTTPVFNLVYGRPGVLYLVTNADGQQ